MADPPPGYTLLPCGCWLADDGITTLMVSKTSVPIDASLLLKRGKTIGVEGDSGG